MRLTRILSFQIYSSFVFVFEHKQLFLFRLPQPIKNDEILFFSHYVFICFLYNNYLFVLFSLIQWHISSCIIEIGYMFRAYVYIRNNIHTILYCRYSTYRVQTHANQYCVLLLVCSVFFFTCRTLEL